MSDSTDKAQQLLVLVRKFVSDFIALDVATPPPPTKVLMESKDGTAITPGTGVIVDSKLTQWAIGTDSKVYVKRVGTDTAVPAGYTADVVMGRYSNHQFIQHNKQDGQWGWDDSKADWVQLVAPKPGTPPTQQGAGNWQTDQYNGTRIYVLPPASGTTKGILLCLHQLQDDGDQPRQWAQWVNTAEFRTAHPDIACVVPTCPNSGEQRNWGGVRDDADVHDFDNALAYCKQYKAGLPSTVDLYVAGDSMGGIGAWNAVCRHADEFTAALILAGATYNNSVASAIAGIAKCAVWSIHGQNDTSVPLDFDRNVSGDIKAHPELATRFKYTEVAGGTHDVWDDYLARAEVWTWLFSWTRSKSGSTGNGSTGGSHPPVSGRSLPLPQGQLSSKGSQLVASDGSSVRIASVGSTWNDATGIHRTGDGMKRARELGFNTMRISWHNAWLSGCLTAMDYAVQKATEAGMRVIFVCHTNEGGHGPQDNWGAQQKNGLWYDMGGGSDGTDGGGNRGTVDQSRFKADWLAVAQRYRDTDTVIGYDLRNEPLGYPGMCSWGDGDRNHDIRMMYEDVGNAILAVDPSKLIICAGPQRYDTQAPWGDLRGVRGSPVRLSVPGRVVYTVHDYPQYIGGYAPDQGQAKHDQATTAWGYLIKENIAPVWIGEMGANCTDAAQQGWAQSLLDYMNGKVQGGPSFAAGEQGISGSWWAWGDTGNQDIVGVLSGNTARPEQQRYWSQMLFNR